MECSGATIAQCGLRFLGWRHPLASASLVAEITGACHPPWLILVVLIVLFERKWRKHLKLMVEKRFLSEGQILSVYHFRAPLLQNDRNLAQTILGRKREMYWLVILQPVCWGGPGDKTRSLEPYTAALWDFSFIHFFIGQDFGPKIFQNALTKISLKARNITRSSGALKCAITDTFTYTYTYMRTLIKSLRKIFCQISCF